MRHHAVELFRSLNDSRPLPAELLPGRRPPRTFEPTVLLPLAGYGLEPGDVIKLFGRVEDNDPAGAKGSESPVVTLRIISQEEFERMVRARQGLEVLLTKYREAQRRMEGLADKMDGLRKKLKKLPPGSLAAKETRQELGKLQRLLRPSRESLRQGGRPQTSIRHRPEALARNQQPGRVDRKHGQGTGKTGKADRPAQRRPGQAAGRDAKAIGQPPAELR